LRNEATEQEVVLWKHLKNSGLGHKFRRQHSVGNFVLDFYCPEKLLAIELDGNQHLDAVEKDQERTNYLNSLNITVIRFWNKEINQSLEVVLELIKKELNKNPSLVKEG
jgi:very-short-patch-repair endonuclease